MDKEIDPFTFRVETVMKLRKKKHSQSTTLATRLIRSVYAEESIIDWPITGISRNKQGNLCLHGGDKELLTKAHPLIEHELQFMLDNATIATTRVQDVDDQFGSEDEDMEPRNLFQVENRGTQDPPG